MSDRMHGEGLWENGIVGEWRMENGEWGMENAHFAYEEQGGLRTLQVSNCAPVK